MCLDTALYALVMTLIVMMDWDHSILGLYGPTANCNHNIPRFAITFVCLEVTTKGFIYVTL
jgi:hypothetical protein